MIVYHDPMGKLKEAGYSSYRILKEGLIPQSTTTKLRAGKPVSLETIDKICQLTRLPICQIVSIELDPIEKKKNEEE